MRNIRRSQGTREMVFKDQRGFAMLFSFQNSIDAVCFCFHAHRLNTDLKFEQDSKTMLIFKNQFSNCPVWLRHTVLLVN